MDKIRFVSHMFALAVISTMYGIIKIVTNILR